MSNQTTSSRESLVSDMESSPLLSSSHKRKATDELSTNPHTVKVRKRNEKIGQDPIRSQIEKAKQADQGAVTYARKVLKKSALYIQASEAEKTQMMLDSEMITRLKR